MSIPLRVKRCTKHKDACACRTYRAEQMERALKVIQTWASYDIEHFGGDALGVMNCEAVRALCVTALGPKPGTP